MKEGLYNKIDKFCNETDWSKYPTYEHALEEFIKGIVAEETKELEKENAELKENLKTAYRKGMRHMAKALKDYDRTDGVWTDYFEHTVDKVLQKEQVGFEKYGTLAEQLTKAKEIICEYVRLANLEKEDTVAIWQLYHKAEQFLNSEVEK